MRVSISTHLDAEPQWVAAQLQSTAVFRHIAAPLLTFGTATGAPWPRLWPPGELHMHMRLLGLLPLGRQTVRTCIEPSLEPGGWPALRDNGDGALLHRWDHRILLQPLPGGRTLYTDVVEVQARHLPWLMTPLYALFAQLFYRHRQRGWRLLARGHAGAGAPPTPAHRQEAFAYLMGQAPSTRSTTAAGATAEAWRWLEAAHVLGQGALALHWRSHIAMLNYALQLRDTREAAGQLLRLALVPLGHLLGRLPAGNIGRARVAALRPIEPPAGVAALIREALARTALPPASIAPGR